MLELHVCIPRSFLVINVCNQWKTLCSPCRIFYTTNPNWALYTVYVKKNYKEDKSGGIIEI